MVGYIFGFSMNSIVEFELCEDRIAYGRGVICPLFARIWSAVAGVGVSNSICAPHWSRQIYVTVISIRRGI